MTSSAPHVPDFVSLVVSREEVQLLDVDPILTSLRALLASPDTARQSCESVDVSFHGFDDTTDELPEIEQVRNFVHAMDDGFPFWLYFLSKETLSLHALLRCLLPPFLTPEAEARHFPERISELLLTRWIPALNQVAEYVGLDEPGVNEITDRAVDYIQLGPAHNRR